MPNATERKALILCAFFAGLLCAIPMVGKVAFGGTSFVAILKTLGGILWALRHPTVLGVWIVGAALAGVHLWMSRREAKPEQQAQQAAAPGLPEAVPPDAAGTLPDAPGGA